MILPPSRMAGAERWIPGLELKTIMDCGHRTQQERPEEFNALMIDWLTRKFKS
ncbi:MAG: alpha/beta hydrolase [Candidatus Hydrogenedentes bacterium]|nr:alpha/beta hydrolase [Candidatus Hydrogenedentota bacterium]